MMLARRIQRQQRYLDDLRATGVREDDPRLAFFFEMICHHPRLREARWIGSHERGALYAYRSAAGAAAPPVTVYFVVAPVNANLVYLEGLMCKASSEA